MSQYVITPVHPVEPNRDNEVMLVIVQLSPALMGLIKRLHVQLTSFKHVTGAYAIDAFDYTPIFLKETYEGKWHTVQEFLENNWRDADNDLVMDTLANGMEVYLPGHKMLTVFLSRGEEEWPRVRQDTTTLRVYEGGFKWITIEKFTTHRYETMQVPFAHLPEGLWNVEST